jgi:hypothetical protein
MTLSCLLWFKKGIRAAFPMMIAREMTQVKAGYPTTCLATSQSKAVQRAQTLRLLKGARRERLCRLTFSPSEKNAAGAVAAATRVCHSCRSEPLDKATTSAAAAAAMTASCRMSLVCSLAKTAVTTLASVISSLLVMTRCHRFLLSKFLEEQIQPVKVALIAQTSLRHWLLVLKFKTAATVATHQMMKTAFRVSWNETVVLPMQAHTLKLSHHPNHNHLNNSQGLQGELGPRRRRARTRLVVAAEAGGRH